MTPSLLEDSAAADSDAADGSESPNLPIRSGSGPWSRDLAPRGTTNPPARLVCDVAIVGAGVTGSMLAEALTRDGHSVIVLDRGDPARGSTAASTAMILWEIDTPLAELAGLYGFDKAAAIYRRSHAALLDLGTTVAALRIPCDYRPRLSLYVGADADSVSTLAVEAAMRSRAELPGGLLDRAALLARFDIDRAAAILSPDSAEADPVRLAHGMLSAALARGAQFVETSVVSHDWDSHSAYLGLADGGSVEAKHVVLATGYDMPDFVPSQMHRILSTWCFSTAPQPDRLWQDGALIWEDSEPYLYCRTLPDGRIIVGGEDEALPTAGARDAVTAAKIARLQAKMRSLWPAADYETQSTWSAEFGETLDGLPLIGRVAGAPRFLAAYGYGGNGITFSFMASRILAAMLRGEDRPWFGDFDLQRQAPGA